MSTYLFIGGAYGDEYWTSSEPTPDQMQVWACGELLVFKVDSEMRVYQPDGSGAWAVVKALPVPQTKGPPEGRP
jgi:hypothetical protein